MVRWAVLTVTAALLWPAMTAFGEEEAPGRIIEVAPGEDYRAALNRLQPGDELRLLPGVHEGHTVVRVSGEPGRPITIRGVIEDGRRPELRFTGRGHNLWRIRGSHLRIRDLAFHATHAYAIRVDRADDITIENCLFRACGGGDISANTADVDGLRIIGCRFIESRRTPVYIGHHQGRLSIDNFRFEGNVIDGSRIEGGIGYGIQLKLNVRGGVIRDNFITATRGPGIMVYGAEDAGDEDANTIERNLVIGSRRNPGIAVGGGPAVVRHNIVLGGRAGGIAVFDYGGRGLLERISIDRNIAALNRGHDLSIRGRVRDLTVKANRIWTRPGGGAGGGIRGLSAAEAAEMDNRIEAAGEALSRAVEQLDGFVPEEAAMTATGRRLQEGLPADEGALTAMLHALLDGAVAD